MKSFAFVLILVASQAYLCLGDAAISREEFNAACRAAGYEEPPADVYEECFASGLADNYSREELAMMIAQLIHESGGFKFKEELACLEESNKGCPNNYGYNGNGKYYYGRGFIHLTWADNYQRAGDALGVDLIKNPELVSQTDMACKTTFWYWETAVHKTLGDCSQFGLSTRAINGGLECGDGPNHSIAHERYQKYLKVAGALGVSPASEGGC